jgi:hypothetical protein
MNSAKWTNSLAFDPVTGLTVAAVGDDKMLRIWSIDTSQEEVSEVYCSLLKSRGISVQFVRIKSNAISITTKMDPCLLDWLMGPFS